MTRAALMTLTVSFIAAGCASNQLIAPRVVWEMDIYAPNSIGINPPPKPISTRKVSGSAVYVGKGQFVTAAHVIYGSSSASSLPYIRRPLYVTVGEKVIFAVRQRAAPYQSSTNEYGSEFLDAGVIDTQVSAADNLKISESVFCAEPPSDTSMVEVRTMHGLRVAHMSKAIGPYESLDIVAEPGDSGGGVYAKSGCLVGIISRAWPNDAQIKTNTLVVPSSVLRAYLTTTTD